MIDRNQLNKLTTNMLEAQKEGEKSFFTYLKTISTLAVALIGLLISLKPTVLPNKESKILFLLSIALIGFCILFSLGAQFFEIVAYRKEVKQRKNHILKFLDETQAKEDLIAIIKKPWYFQVMEVGTFISLVLSIGSLITYSFFLVK